MYYFIDETMLIVTKKLISICDPFWESLPKHTETTIEI